MSTKKKNLIERLLIFLHITRRKRFGLSHPLNIIEKTYVPYEKKDWSIIHANLDKVPFKGDGERIAILDTGADKTHKDLEGQLEFYNFISGDRNDTDENGHGTFTAGEVLAKDNGDGLIGVAPKAIGFCCKVLFGDQRDNNIDCEANLCNAIRAAYTNGCGVISMSLGFTYNSSLIQTALEEAVSHGCIPVASSGNDGMMGSLNFNYPAAYECCVSVTAANKKDMPNWFSSSGIGGIGGNRLKQPEIAIASREYYWGCLPNNLYGRMQGTSMACPVLAGTALLWRESMVRKGKLPSGENVLKEFRNWLQQVAIDTNQNGWDSDLGYGVLILKDGDL